MLLQTGKSTLDFLVSFSLSSCVVSTNGDQRTGASPVRFMASLYSFLLSLRIWGTSRLLLSCLLYVIYYTLFEHSLIME